MGVEWDLVEGLGQELVLWVLLGQGLVLWVRLGQGLVLGVVSLFVVQESGVKVYGYGRLSLRVVLRVVVVQDVWGLVLQRWVQESEDQFQRWLWFLLMCLGFQGCLMPTPFCLQGGFAR